MKIALSKASLILLSCLMFSNARAQVKVGAIAPVSKPPNLPSGQKVIFEEDEFKGYPVKITGVYQDGKPVEMGTPFHADVDWLKRVDVDLECVS